MKIIFLLISGLFLVSGTELSDLTEEQRTLLEDFEAEKGVTVEAKDRARLIDILERDYEEEEEISLEDQQFLTGLLKIDETEIEKEVAISKQKIYDLTAEAKKANAIPKNWDSYAKGWVTKGKYQKGPTCFLYSATAVMETCYLKATVDPNKVINLDDPESRPSDKNGPYVNMAERFALACKGSKKFGAPNIAQPWNVIGYVKRLGGIAPNETDWNDPNKYNKNCEEALKDMDNWYKPNEKDARIVRLGAAFCGNPDVVKYLVSTYGAITINTRGGIHAEMIYGYGNDEDGLGDYYLMKNSYASMWRHESKRNGKNAAFNRVYLDSDYAKKRLLFKSGGGYCGFAECARITSNPHDECAKTKIEGMLKDGKKLVEGTNELFGILKKKEKNERKCVKVYKDQNPTWSKQDAKDKCKEMDNYTLRKAKMVAWCRGASCRCPGAYKRNNDSCCQYFEKRLLEPTVEE